MKQSVLWKTLLLLGIVPLILPFLSGIYHTTIESWTLLDWLILYSFVYWPTYLLGLILIALSLYKLKKLHK